MASKKSTTTAPTATITLTEEALQSLIAGAVAQALAAAKPVRAKATDDEKEQKRAAKAAQAAADAEGLPMAPEGVSLLPKRRPFDPRMAWAKENPGPCLIRSFSQKDGSPQTWVATDWKPAKSGKGFICIVRFVELVAEPTDDTEDFLRSVG